MRYFTLMMLLWTTTAINTANAEPVVAFQREIWPGYVDVGQPYYEVNQELGRAWLATDINYSTGAEDIRWDRQRGLVEGMWFDQQTNTIYWNGVACATVSGRLGRRIQPTGNCRLRATVNRLPVDTGFDIRQVYHLTVTIEAQ